MSSPNTTGQFVLQIVGVTDGKVLSRPSQKHIMCEGLADVHINKKNIDVLAYSPSLGCDGLVESDMDVLVAPCPQMKKILMYWFLWERVLSLLHIRSSYLFSGKKMTLLNKSL